MVSTYLPKQKGSWKSLFYCCSTPKEFSVMAIDSHDVEAVVCDQCFLWWCWVGEGITYPIIHFLVHGKHDGANFKSVHQSIRKVHLF